MKRSAIGVFNGNWKNKWRRDIEDMESDRREFIKQENQLNFGDALTGLKAADPHWEAWFDDDANIPAIIHWLDSEEIRQLCERMNLRAAAVTKEIHEKNFA